jgi:hypothetical protein
MESIILTDVIKQTNDGFVFVDVDDNFIYEQYSDLKVLNKEYPPFHESLYYGIGGHISVIKNYELKKRPKIKEVGKTVVFEVVLRPIEINPKKWKDMEKVWYLEVFSSDLENIRESYGLEPKIEGKEFHITIAVQRKD